MPEKLEDQEYHPCVFCLSPEGILVKDISEDKKFQCQQSHCSGTLRQTSIYFFPREKAGEYKLVGTKEGSPMAEAALREQTTEE